MKAYVFKLQCRIFRAAKDGNVQLVSDLQKLLVRSVAARRLAVLQVTQINRGKNTPGIDGQCSLKVAEKWQLAMNMELLERHAPLLRKWLPKPGSTERRPIGVPTIKDRCRGALVALALTPELEAKLGASFFGYRPGRSPQDAIATVRNLVNRCPGGKYVLDADVRKFFDNVSHQWLHRATRHYPRPIRDFLKGLLRAPLMDGTLMPPGKTGFPQGTPISPVLANLTLLGLPEYVQASFMKARKAKTITGIPPAVVIYADDLHVIHADVAVVELARNWIEEFLQERGLELNPDKSATFHTIVAHGGKPGFNLLGTHVRAYPVGQHHRGKLGLRHKCLIRISKPRLRQYQEKLRQILASNRTTPVGKLIRCLNGTIRGFANYFRSINASKDFTKLDHTLFQMLWHHMRRRHGKNSNADRIYSRFWKLPNNRVRFHDPDTGVQLLLHGGFHHKNHIMVKAAASPFDGNKEYWDKRRWRKRQGTHREGETLKHTPLPEHQTESNEDSTVWLLRDHGDIRRLEGNKHKPHDNTNEEPGALKGAHPVLNERASCEGILDSDYITKATAVATT